MKEFTPPRSTSHKKLSVRTGSGLHVEYADGFGLIRPPNTTPIIVPPDNEATLQRIQQEFLAVLPASSPDLALPF